MADHGTPTPTSTHETGSGHGAAPSRSVKRPRPVKSCIECRKRKLKCDRLLPCSQCQKSQRHCRYAPDGDAANLSDASDADVSERASKKNCVPSAHEQTPRSRERPLPASSQHSLLDDYGARLDRLENIVLTNAEKSVKSTPTLRHQPLKSSSMTIRGLTVKGGLRTRFFGQNSTRVLLNLFDEAKEFMFARSKPREVSEAFSDIQKIHRTLQDEQRKALTPIPVYVDSMTPVQKRMADILPKKAVCDQFLQVYLMASESIYRVVHIPSFMSIYNRWWEHSVQSESFLPQLLSILCIGYRFIGPGKGLQPDRDGVHIPTACSLVRSWLDSLRGKQLVDFGTLQAEVLLLLAQRMINPKNQETWTHLGLIVRMAMTMGLHRDASEFPHKISAYWGEQRRRLWYTILELDVQMSTQCNLPVCVRDGDFTCRPPRNLNDDEIYLDMQELPESRPIDHMTDSQIQVYASSTLRYRFKVVDLINRIDSLTDYQQVIECGTALERALDDIRTVTPRMLPATPEERNKQWAIRTVLDMHCRRALLNLYRPFALSTPDVPQQILAAYLRSSVAFLTYLDDLDPSSESYTQLWHSHNLVFRQDILQAALSVCYYIKHIIVANNINNNDNTQGSSNAATTLRPRTWHPVRTQPETIEEACLLASESSIALALPRLIRVVETAFTRSMVRRIREIGTDLKDLVTLTVVLSVCRGGTGMEVQKRALEGLQAIIDTGLQSMQTSHEAIASLPTPMSLANIQTPPGFVNPVQPFILNDELPNVIPDDFAMWDMEFWQPLLQNSTI
ncbi:fungal-specific transcription factor domain-containing protein [Apiospora arundinis]|uniref:Fungal-specific transcription factor domain-containing protein n=1 Tax=Apiospora arundinis TaxID=335852 RepID=A0ABR2IES7_9PEZI